MSGINVEYFDKLILAQGVEYTTNSHATGLNNNVLVIGGSGSGKTMSIAEPRLLEAYGSSLVVTLSKRRLADMYTPLLQKRGYKVMVLDFTEPTASTVGYDPLSYVREEEDVAYLAEALVMSNPQKRCSTADPYWSDAAVCLMSALIQYVRESVTNPSFDSVLTALAELTIFSDGNLTTMTSLDDMFDALAKKNRDSYAVRNWATFRELPIRTSLCVFSELNSSITRTFTHRVRQLMTMPELIDFTRIGTERSVLFVIGSPVNNALYQFIDLLYSQMIKELFSYAEQQKNGEGLPVPVTFIFDDFASGSRIHGFSEIISTSRAARMSFILLLQSESQLEHMYGPAAAQSIEDNCDSMVFMGGNNLETAQKIGLRIDQSPQEVLIMPLGWEWVFRRGEEPVFVERYDTPNDPRYIAARRAFERTIAETEGSGASRRRDADKAAQDKHRLASIKAGEQKRPTRDEVRSENLTALIDTSREIIRMYEMRGETKKQADEIAILASLYMEKSDVHDVKAHEEVFSLACQLVDLGDCSRAERIMDKLCDRHCSSFGPADNTTLKYLALLCIIQEKINAHRKASKNLSRLKSYGSDRMPLLVTKTEEICRKIRENK